MNSFKFLPRFVFAALFCLKGITGMAEINKVYIVPANEEFPETPVHGKVPFLQWLGSDRISFAKGQSYRIWIDFASQLPEGSTMNSSAKSAVISDCRRKLNGFEFTLKVLNDAKRLSPFSIGLKIGNSKMTDVVPCKVVEIGRIDSWVLQDTTNTTFAGLFSKTTYWTFHYTHGTGPRVWSFYGEGLGNARFDYATNGGLAHGLQFYTDLTVQSDSSFDLVFTVSNDVVSETGSMREDIFSLIYDSGSDRRYEWITYRYAVPSVLENSTDQEGVLADAAFEVLPGIRKPLCPTCKGYHRFRDTGFKVD